MEEDKTITIRHYEASDLESGRALWVELTEWHRAIYQSPGIGGSDPGLQFDEHLERVGPDHIWMAEMDGRVIGLSGLIVNPGNVAELEPLVVIQAYRRMGIGRMLAEAVIEEARKQGLHQLMVRPVARNREAIQFFHKMGFSILGQIELFMDLKSPDKQGWIAGERIAGLEFKF